MLPKQNYFLTEMAPVMKQDRLKGEHLRPQVISDLGDAGAASLTLSPALAPQLTFWLRLT